MEFSLSKTTKEKEWDTQAKAALRESRHVLDKLISESRARTSEVRVEGDFHEAGVRVEEEGRRSDRLFALNQLQLQNSEASAAIALQWAGLGDHDVPQDLLGALLEQKRRCDDVVAAKDNVIGSLAGELEAKDEEYVAELKREADKIDELLGRMDVSFRELQAAYDAQLGKLEDTFERELEELHTANSGEIKSLMEKRAKMEEQHMNDRLALLKANQDEVEELQRQQGEGINIVTIRLQTSVQVLRQQLEEMRATYALNSQKLEYNIKILDRREFENNLTISQQKRKINSLGDQVAALRAKYEKQDKEYRYQNQKLTNDYKRITDQYKELQRKFKHFQLADAKKFKEVWDMNEEIVAEYIGKTLQADAIIFEQQLGLKWVPPAQDLFTIREQALPIDSEGNPVIPMAGSGGGGEGGGLGGREGGVGGGEGGEGGGGKGKGKISVLAHEGSAGIARAILDMLCDEAGFLVEEKVQAMLDPLPRDEQNLLMINSIFKALKVESRAEIDKLLSYFVADPDSFGLEHLDTADGVVTTGRTGMLGGGEDPSSATIDPSRVIPALRRFVQDHNRDLDLSRQSTKRSTSLMFMREQKEMARKLEREYWEKLSGIISDKTYRVWLALKKGLVAYHEVLEERAGLLDETDGIRQQNYELKQLLNSYLGQGVNDELYVPPYATHGFIPQ